MALLFVINLNITLAASGTLATCRKIQYLRTLVCAETLRQFDLFSADVEVMSSNCGNYFLGLNL